MRKVVEQASHAFLRREKYKVGNTEVRVRDGVVQMLLHGNVIAQRTGLAYTISTCGWNTPTTRSRLNGLVGVKVYQVKGELYLNNIPWDGMEIIIGGGYE